jgi:excisionase family DNA binding protein
MVAICASELEARRRRLEELFEDEPFLSPTMRARDLHDRQPPSGHGRQLPAGLVPMAETWPEPPAMSAAPAHSPAMDNVVRLGFVVNLKQESQGFRAELQPEESPAVMTATEAARFMRISQGTLRRWVKHLGLPCAQIGRARRFRKNAVLRWLKAQEGKA